MSLLAENALVGSTYHSPKGIPCMVVEITETEVKLRSLITSQIVSVPYGTELNETTESIDETKYASTVVGKGIRSKEKPKKEKKEKVVKEKVVKEKTTTVSSILTAAMSNIEVGQSVVQEDLIKEVQQTFPDLPNNKLSFRVSMTIQNLKKKGLTFVRNDGKILREK